MQRFRKKEGLIPVAFCILSHGVIVEVCDYLFKNNQFLSIKLQRDQTGLKNYEISLKRNRNEDFIKRLSFHKKLEQTIKSSEMTSNFKKNQFPAL